MLERHLHECKIQIDSETTHSLKSFPEFWTTNTEFGQTHYRVCRLDRALNGLSSAADSTPCRDLQKELLSHTITGQMCTAVTSSNCTMQFWIKSQSLSSGMHQLFEKYLHLLTEQILVKPLQLSIYITSHLQTCWRSLCHWDTLWPWYVSMNYLVSIKDSMYKNIYIL